MKMMVEYDPCQFLGSCFKQAKRQCEQCKKKFCRDHYYDHQCHVRNNSNSERIIEE